MNTPLNVLDFTESCLRISLYPSQRFLLKIIFGVPLDYQPGTIDVWDDTHECKVYSLSEPDYLKFCAEEGRCNYSDWRDLPERGFRESHLFQGRRSGKSTLLQVATVYKVYRILKLGNPQAFFNLVPGAPIDFSTICMDEESARRMNDGLADNINYYYREEFEPYLKHKGKWGVQLLTEVDREKFDASPTLSVRAYPASVNTVRGPSSITLMLDEFAHFKNSFNLYAAAVPATMMFHHEEEGKDYCDALIMSASSPWYTSGKMFELFDWGMQDNRWKDMFVHNETTATLNPHVSSSFLQREKAMHGKYFAAEFGGQFLYDNPRDPEHEKPMTYKQYREKLEKTPKGLRGFKKELEQ